MFWDLNRDHENLTGLGVDAATKCRLECFFRQYKLKKLSQVFQKHDLQSFYQFLSHLPIEKLDFATYPQVSDQELACFAKITSLKEINLKNRFKITGKSLSVLPASLKKLSLYACDQLTDDDLVYLKHLNQLEELTLGLYY